MSDQNNLKFSVRFVTATFQSITTIVTRSVWEVGNLKCVVETLLLFVFVLATIICYYYMSFSCIRLHDIEKKMYLFYWYYIISSLQIIYTCTYIYSWLVKSGCLPSICKITFAEKYALMQNDVMIFELTFLFFLKVIELGCNLNYISRIFWCVYV